jgi:hypothetical protein
MKQFTRVEKPQKLMPGSFIGGLVTTQDGITECQSAVKSCVAHLRLMRGM